MSFGNRISGIKREDVFFRQALFPVMEILTKIFSGKAPFLFNY
jgi:hypothetical protein